MKRWLVIVATALAVVALLWAWRPWHKPDAAPRYRVAQIERGALSAAVTASGALNALVTVQVGSQVSGLIKEIHADFNAEVKRGQVIARLDPEAFETRVAQAEADVKAAESGAEVARGSVLARQAEENKAHIALDDARRTLERKRALVEKQFISAAELDIALAASETAREQLRLVRAEAEVARAQVGSASAAVAQRRAALRQARVELGHTVIRSPVEGVVISRNVDVGQTVAASFQAPVLFVIARDLAKMEVNVAVDEADVGRVRPGQKVRFSVDAYPGERFAGEVSQIRKAPQSNNNVTTYSVMAIVANPELKLLPGMTANARILTEERKSVLKVPNEALRFRPLDADGVPIKLQVRGREEGPGIPGRVWVVDKAGLPAPVTVRLGVSDGKSTEILKGALKEGMEIILAMAEGADKPKKPARPFGMRM